MELLEYLGPSGIPLAVTEASTVLIGTVSSSGLLKQTVLRLKNNQKLLFAGIFISFLAFWVVSSFFGARRPLLPAGTGSKSDTEVQVISAKVALTDNDVRFETVGTARALKSVEIYPAVTEEVLSVHFVAGQQVAGGDLLVQLDDRAEKLAVEMAEVRLREAKGLLTRYESALKEGAVPESEVDSARATVDAAQVTLEQAKLALQERTILAPFSGVAGLPRVDPGDRVTTSTLIAGLDDRHELLVDFEVPELLAATLREGAGITSTTPAFPGRTFDGTISALESRIDAASRTVLARARIGNADDVLRPGMSFELVLRVSGTSYPTIPEIALQWGNEGAFVWVVRDERALRVPVKVISRSIGTVRVQGEIQAGEHIVVEGLQRLEPGRRVRVLGTLGESNKESTGAAPSGRSA